MGNIAESTPAKTPDRRPRRLTVEECRRLSIASLQQVYGAPPDDAEVSDWQLAAPSGRTQRIRVASTPGTLGGRCWWLVCPACGSRRRTLFRPPGAKTRACRSCLRLVYRSQYSALSAEPGKTAVNVIPSQAGPEEI